MTTARPGGEHNPRLINQAVKRMVWALSEVGDDWDDGTAAVLVAMAWRADHKTGEAVLTDDEIVRDATLVSPLVPSLRASSRTGQREILRDFLYER